MALADSNLAALRDLGIIPRLVQLLIKAITAHQQAQQSGMDSAVIDDVHMEEIIESTVGALHQLSRDLHNGIVIRELKCIPVLVQLLYMSWESIQRVACGCLSELANEPVNVELIQMEPVTDRLTELLRSKDHALSTYAAAVLFRLSEDVVSSGGGGSGSATESNGSSGGGREALTPNHYHHNGNEIGMTTRNNKFNSNNNNNMGSADQYVSYKIVDPYEQQEMQSTSSSHYNQLNVDKPRHHNHLTAAHHNQQSHPSQTATTWFDSDL